MFLSDTKKFFYQLVKPIDDSHLITHINVYIPLDFFLSLIREGVVNKLS